ncbi:hypothetical protein O0Q50_22490 [Priestia aryabhattai]|uniref:Uncharacterized protein n=1 Tax=Priestia aryabhattai TaxID=412384 RepID=A0AAX6NDE8_PRIAR|nr:hypothetical protein [Priestia aryabhattai]MDU9693953.1 hypothetical protein [Priestia aryabhattai]NGY88752.1 hypothetical protein [Priestia megaterium]
MALKNKTVQTDTWLEIYTDDSDFESFSVAKLIAEDDDYYLLANVTPGGNSDGFYLLKHTNVNGWQTETNYIKKIKKLYSLKQQEHLKYDGDKDNLFLGLLEFAKQKRLIVSIVMLDSDVYAVQGFVKESDEDFLKITNIDTFGNEDGETILRVEEITAIACDDENGSDLKLLHSNK